MIVKVQVSLYDSGVKRVLIYDESGGVTYEGPISQETLADLTDGLIGTLDHSYWQAEVDAEGKIVLDHPVPDEEW